MSRHKKILSTKPNSATTPHVIPRSHAGPTQSDNSSFAHTLPPFRRSNLDPKYIRYISNNDQPGRPDALLTNTPLSFELKRGRPSWSCQHTSFRDSLL